MTEDERILWRDRLSRRLEWGALDPAYLAQLIAMAREEDLAGAGVRAAVEQAGDLTTQVIAHEADASKAGVDGGPRARAALVAREAMVAAGLPLVPHVLRAYGGPESEVTFSWLGRVHDGEAVPAGETLAVLEAPAAQLLTAERVLLNFLQRLSGVATATRRHVEALGETTTRLLDTRKTTPGFRALEKYAVGQGGGWNHRLGLYDRIMLKDNHLALLQEEGRLSLAAAVEAARRRFPGVPVQVEVDRLGQIPEVLDAGADCLLLDNFSDTDLAEAVELARGRCLTEASGGIGLERLGRLGAFGLDFVSTGACVHHSTWCDMALDWC